MNSRPNVQTRNIYRFSDANWLSGNVGSITRVISVFRKTSLFPLGLRKKQALVSNRTSSRSERGNLSSAITQQVRIRKNCYYLQLFCCQFKVPANLPATQDSNHIRRNRGTPDLLTKRCKKNLNCDDNHNQTTFHCQVIIIVLKFDLRIYKGFIHERFKKH